MIRVHHLNASRSHRILWLLEELGLEYEIVQYQREKSMLAPKTLRAIHPLGKSPVVEEDGRVMAESGAIVELMVERHGAGKLAPARGTPAYERYIYWLHYAEGSMMPPLLLKLVLSKLGPLGWPARGFVDAQLRTHLDFMEGELGRAKYFAGDDFSAADIQMSFPVEAATVRGGLDASRPNLMRFLWEIHQRPAYRRAVERGGELGLGR
ncbi:MAG: glutathione S-transferase [Myxococcota bacterium]|nr:glutathione S-transferase [Myxococcota bacterium]